MEYWQVYRLVESLLEEVDIDVERDMWRWADEDEACTPSGEVKEGLTDALSLFFDMFDEKAQQEVVYAMRKFAYRPTCAHLLAWQGHV
jgi:hypothetical protein